MKAKTHSTPRAHQSPFARENSRAATFESYRALLQGIAYRMLGSVAEAEDIVQETYLKWDQTDTQTIANARAWLVTVCSRLSIDRLKSARARRERYVGPWLPEPLLVEESSPADQLAIDDSVSTALLYTLERLSPAERAAFLLHDVFSYGYEEIASILDKTPAACRKLVSRARAAARERKPKFETDPQLHRRLMESFLDAARQGDLAALESLLAQDATLVSDGGGKAFAARKVLQGVAIISKFFVTTSKQAAQSGNVYAHRPTWYNGAPGLIIYENEIPVSAINIHVSENRIQGFFIHRNPDKLATFAR
ncbi:RNA polymerase sigma-70 factor [Pelagicoccus sp. SDUM812003]|uniref:RNA polymerase sigma-70 factor n=1 Tax=Pelagicoccus sp. SDUM812003 TaxID=3041267 RepID=UPI00280E3ABA|nr:RNA polymerase sigma-70 factor [Pelagicoccus sp. SDUM812003]MDQ8205258.1 RNA polymerase sigma-70 factor [Pelagicoccus sp. SDUM812003]